MNDDTLKEGRESLGGLTSLTSFVAGRARQATLV